VKFLLKVLTGDDPILAETGGKRARRCSPNSGSSKMMSKRAWVELCSAVGIGCSRDRLFIVVRSFGVTASEKVPTANTSGLRLVAREKDFILLSSMGQAPQQGSPDYLA
jgi:hypothetical protein